MNISTAPKPEPADGRHTRWEAHRAQRRMELIKATRRVVHQRGPDVSMDEIVAEVGTSKSVFYRYFNDKIGLQQAVGQYSINRLEARMLEAAKTARTELDGLHAMITVYLEMSAAAPHVYAFATRMPTEVNLFVERFSQFLRQRVMDFAQRNPHRVSDLALRYWPSAVVGFVRSAGEHWLAEPEGPEKPRAEQLGINLAQWLVQGLTDPSFMPQRLTETT